MRRIQGILIALVLLSPLGLAGPADAVTMKTTRFVANFEGFLSCPYNDPAGHATIGYGHLLHYGGVTKKDRRKWGCLSEAQALKLLRKDLKATEDQVYERIGNALVTPSMVTALTSFAFNLGAGALDRTKHKGSGKTTRIGLHIRQGKYRLAGKEILLYDGVIVGGKRIELKGLQIRRRKENRLLIRDISQLKPCTSKCNNGGNSSGNNSTSGGLGV
ncbi:MAG: lysozyme [Solirubrobacterales bacterium]